MGYKKIVQYGNITELYEYERVIKSKPLSELSAHRLVDDAGTVDLSRSYDIKKVRKKKARLYALEKGTYSRSSASIKRSRTNFFRLCHHNNCLANSIHFLTLTFAYDLTFKTASRHVARFMEKIKKNSEGVSVSYISVPELTKKGRYHFHVLVYNLPSEMAGKSEKNAKFTSERKTRNLQRLFERGYVDIVPASFNSIGIAGYMAKYMAKALGDSRVKTRRGYNASRNIEKVRCASGNTLSQWDYMILPTSDLAKVEVVSYDVPYLGNCNLTKITKKI